MPQNMIRIIKPTLLALVVTNSMSIFALESMDDNQLAKVSGQDGININVSMDDAKIGSVTWQDGSAGSLAMKNLALSHPDNNTQRVTSNIQIQTAADSQGNPALKLSLGLGKATVDIPELQLCDSNTNNCQSFGGLAVTNSGADTKFTLVTRNGLFNEDGTARLKAVIDKLSVGIKQKNDGRENQLILGNMYANITANGKLFVTDAEGLKFTGTVDFSQKTLSGYKREGLEVLVQHKVGSNSVTTLGKIALTGGMSDVALNLRGVKGSVIGLGFNNGDNGIAMRMSANFNEDMELRFGGADQVDANGDSKGSGIALTGWQKVGNASQSFNTGNVYVNIVKDNARAIQTLKSNPRLGLTSQQVQNSVNWWKNELNANKGRKFKVEGLDPNISVGKDYLTMGGNGSYNTGYVKAANGGVIRIRDGFKQQRGLGIVNADNNYVSVKSFGDGYIVTGKMQKYNDDGSPDKYWAYDKGSKGGTFERVYKVNANGSVTAYERQVFDKGNNRGVKPVYVWRTDVDGNEIGGGDIVVASFDNHSKRWGNYENKYNAWFKAVDMNSGKNLNGNNFDNTDRTNVFTINAKGEVVNGKKDLFLDRHGFDSNGYLKLNSSGKRVYEYSYKITSINGKDYLIMTHRTDAAKNKSIELAVADTSNISVDTVTDADYSMDLGTISGGANKAKRGVALNVRDMSLQSYPTITKFFDTRIDKSDTQKWALAPLIYDLDANIIVFPKTLTSQAVVAGFTKAGQAFGYKLRATTKGSDTAEISNTHQSAKQTTGLLLTTKDTGNTTRYMGLRHMDSLISAQGDIQITGDGITLTAKDFLFAFRGELATGKMPNTTEVFERKDRLVSLDGSIKGSLAAKLTPTNDGLGIGLRFDLSKDKETGVRVLMPEHSSSVNLTEMTGRVDADVTVNSMNMGDSTNYKGALNIKAKMTINPENKVKDDFRIGNIGFNANPLAGTTDKFNPYQDTRIGEFAITRNVIDANINIRDAN